VKQEVKRRKINIKEKRWKKRTNSIHMLTNRRILYGQNTKSEKKL
jgi:hypothetical protein